MDQETITMPTNEILSVTNDIETSQVSVEQATECPICCDEFNLSSRMPCVCPNDTCKFRCCKQCIRTYITSVPQEAHCMYCKTAYNNGFILVNLNRAYYTKTYKSHVSKVLLDKELITLHNAIDDSKVELEYRQASDKIVALKRLKTELSHETFTTLGDYTTENNKIIAVTHMRK